MKNPYDVLGVSPLDSKATIKERYRKLCKKYHPDIAGDSGVAKFREVNEAWNLIKDAVTNDKQQYWSHSTLFNYKKREVD